MTSRFWFLATTLGALVGCSSAPTQGFGDPGSGTGDTTSTGDDGGTSSPTDPSSSGSGASASSDSGLDAYVTPIHYSDAAAGKFYDTSIPDADEAQSVTLTITPFTVPAGDEVYMCQWFANPFGQDVDIVEIDGQMSSGSHHFFVFNMDPSTLQTTASPLAPCPAAGLEFFPYIYLSQQPNWDVTYPQPNMGYPLVAANGLMMNLHFLNTGSTAIDAQATVTIHTAKPGVVTVPVGNLFLNNQSMSVPANTPESAPIWQSASNTPITTFDYNILQSWSHMHQYGLKFETILSPSTTPFYTETNWNAPPVTNYWPNPIAVPSGTQITWQCQYYNPTSATMTFGDSALTNVMCIYFGQYYPTVPSTTPGYPDIVNVITGG
jgi:hypothetical protein